MSLCLEVKDGCKSEISFIRFPSGCTVFLKAMFSMSTMNQVTGSDGKWAAHRSYWLIYIPAKKLLPREFAFTTHHWLGSVLVLSSTLAAGSCLLRTWSDKAIVHRLSSSKHRTDSSQADGAGSGTCSSRRRGYFRHTMGDHTRTKWCLHPSSVWCTERKLLADEF